MAEDEVIGGVAITIRGDYSQLGADFDAAVTEAVAAGSTLAEAISNTLAQADSSAATQAFADVGTAAQEAIGGVTQLGDAVTDASGQLGLFGNALDSVPFSDATGQLNMFTDELEGFAPTVDTATGSLNEFAAAEHTVVEASGEAESALGSIREQLLEFGEALAITEGMREFGVEALETFGEVEKASIALTALTGSAEGAEEALSGLKDLSISDALSFPSLVTAQVRMTAFGFTASQIPVVMQDVANAAAGTMGSFDAVSNAIDRMVISGAAGARQLARLGLSLTDLGNQMVGTTSGLTFAADEAAKAFKALDVSDRIQVLTQALQKYQGVAEQTAKGISGQWQNLKTETEFAFEGIGKALAPVVTQLLDFANSDVIPFLNDLIDDFNSLPTPAKDTAVALGLIVGALAPMAVALAGFGLLITGLTAALPALEGMLGTAGITGGFAGLGSAILTATPYVVAFAAALKLIDFTGVDTAMMGWVADIKREWPGLVAQFNSLNDVSGWSSKLPGQLDSVATAEQNAAKGMQEWGTASQFLDGVPRALAVISQSYGDMTTALKGQIDALNTLGNIPLLNYQFQGIPGDVQSGVQGGRRLTAAAPDELTKKQIAAAKVAATEQMLDSSGFYLGGTQGIQQTAPGQMTPDQFQAMSSAASDFNATLVETKDDAEDIFDAVQRVNLNVESTGSELDFDNAAIQRATESSEMWSLGTDVVAETFKGLTVDIDETSGHIGTITEGWDNFGTHGRNAIVQIDSAIASGLSKSLLGIIEGTESVSQAFTKMGEQIANVILTTILKNALTPLIGELRGFLTSLPEVGKGFQDIFNLIQPPQHSLYTSPIGPALTPGYDPAHPYATSPSTSQPADVQAGGTGGDLMTQIAVAVTPLVISLGVNTTAVTENTTAVGVNTVTTEGLIASGAVIKASFETLTPEIADLTEKFTPIGGDVQTLAKGVIDNTTATASNSTALTSLTKDFGAAVPSGAGGIPSSSGLGSGSGEGVGAEGSALPGGASGDFGGETGSDTVTSGAIAGSDVSGGGLGGLGGLLSSFSDLAGGNVIGAGIAAAAGITQGIQMEHLNNLMDKVEKSTRGALNQLEDIQATLNLYLPNELHLVDIWAQLQTNMTVIDSDLRGLAMGISPTGSTTHVTASDVTDNTDALHNSTMTTSNLVHGVDVLGLNTGQLLASRIPTASTSFPSQVSGVPLQGGGTWQTPDEIAALLALGGGGLGGSGALAGSGPGGALAPRAGYSIVGTYPGSQQYVPDVQGGFANGPAAPSSGYNSDQLNAAGGQLSPGLQAFNANLAQFSSFANVQLQNQTYINGVADWFRSTFGSSVTSTNDVASKFGQTQVSDAQLQQVLTATNSQSTVAEVRGALAEYLDPNRIPITKSVGTVPYSVATIQNDYGSLAPTGPSPLSTSALSTALTAALAPMLSSTRPISVTVNAANPLTAFVSGVRNVGVKI